MIIAAVALLATPVALAQLPVEQCPRVAQIAGEHTGDRAVIADDGKMAVVQCGNGEVLLWQAGTPNFKPVGRTTLFQAARDAAIIPANLRCPWEASYKNHPSGEPDCDVLEHRNATYILRRGPTFFLVEGGTVIRESTIWQTFGALADRGDKLDLYVFDAETRPNKLQRLPVSGGQMTTVTRLVRPNLLFEDGEGEANRVGYSDATRSVILSFAGVFRVAQEMTFLRAFGEDGVERWHITASLPSRDTSLIVGDAAQVILFNGGRHLLFARTSDGMETQVLDARNGAVAGKLVGWPLAGARDANTVVIRDKADAMTVVQVSFNAEASPDASLHR